VNDYQKSAAILAFSALFSAPVRAERPGTPPIVDRARGAERVVVGTVVSVVPRFDTNEHGDRLIVSQTVLRVEETLKGAPAQTLTVDIEGGTVGDLTMKVSDVRAVGVGERTVLFVRTNRRGALVPHLRGEGILHLNSRDEDDDEKVTLADVRAKVRGGAR
jgi:hypothetical protein